jgi:hypothetical protein
MKVKDRLQVPATLHLQKAPPASTEWVSHPGWKSRVLCQPTHISVTIETELWRLDHLNAELNPICHLLVLLGDLTFMGPCIVSKFQYISNKKQRYAVYSYLETALHVLGGTFIHHQDRIQLYLQHLVFVTPLLLSAAIVEELEPV